MESSSSFSSGSSTSLISFYSARLRNARAWFIPLSLSFSLSPCFSSTSSGVFVEHNLQRLLSNLCSSRFPELAFGIKIRSLFVPRAKNRLSKKYAAGGEIQNILEAKEMDLLCWLRFWADLIFWCGFFAIWKLAREKMTLSVSAPKTTSIDRWVSGLSGGVKKQLKSFSLVVDFAKKGLNRGAVTRSEWANAVRKEAFSL